VAIDGPGTLLWPASLDLAVGGVVAVACVPGGEEGAASTLAKVWTVEVIGGACDGEVVARSAGTGASYSTLALPAGTMVAGASYRVVLRATVTARGVEYAQEAQVAIDAYALDLGVHVARALRSITIPVDVPLELTLEVSGVDTAPPAAAPEPTCTRGRRGDSPAFGVVWACFDAADGSAMASRANPTEALHLGAFSWGEGNGSLLIPAALGPGPGVYVCNATAKRFSDGAVGTATMDVAVSSGSPPALRVGANTRTGSRIPADARLAIEAVVTPGSGDVDSLIWRAELSREGRVHASGRCAGLSVPPLAAILAPPLRRTPVGSANLVIAPCALAPGATYAFTLQATDVYGAFASARVVVHVNGPPDGGHLALDPPAPYAAVVGVRDGAVVVRQSGWSDAEGDYPLLYSFSLRRGVVGNGGAFESTEPRQPLNSAPQPIAEASTALLPTGELEFVGDVVDAWGASAQARVRVRVPESAASGDAVSQAVADATSAVLPGLTFASADAALATAGLLARALNGPLPANGSTTGSNFSVPSCGVPAGVVACGVRTSLVDAIAGAVFGQAGADAGGFASLEGVALAVGALAAAAAVPEQLDAETTSLAADAVEVLARETRRLAEADATPADAQVSDILYSLSNLLSATYQQAVLVQSSNASSAPPSRRLQASSWDVFDAVFSAGRDLSFALLAGVLAGEPASLTDQANIAIGVLRMAPELSAEANSTVPLELPVSASSEQPDARVLVESHSGLAIGARVGVTAPALARASNTSRAAAVDLRAIFSRFSREDMKLALAGGDDSPRKAIVAPTLDVTLSSGGSDIGSWGEGAAAPEAVATLDLPVARDASGEEVECVFWDEALVAWSTQGVETVETDTGVRCTAFHLTAFSARRSVPSPSPPATVPADGDDSVRPDLLDANDVTEQDVAIVVAAGPTATLPWIIVGVINACWIGAFAIIFAKSKCASQEAQYQAHAQFHRQRVRMRANETPFKMELGRQWKWIKSQHKLLRTFFRINRLNDENKLALSGYQKVAVVTLVVCFKLLACSLLYREAGSAVEARAWEGNAARLIVTAIVAAVMVLPASFLVDRLFTNAQFITLCRPKTDKEMSEEALFAVAHFEAIADSLGRLRAIRIWRAVVEAMRVHEWASDRRSNMKLAVALERVHGSRSSAPAVGSRPPGTILPPLPAQPVVPPSAGEGAPADAVRACGDRVVPVPLPPITTPSPPRRPATSGDAPMTSSPGGAAISPVLHEDVPIHPEADVERYSSPGPARSSALATASPRALSPGRRALQNLGGMSFSLRGRSSSKAPPGDGSVSGRRRRSLSFQERGKYLTRRARGAVTPPDAAASPSQAKVRGIYLQPELLFLSRTSRTHELRAAMSSALVWWKIAAGVAPPPADEREEGSTLAAAGLLSRSFVQISRPVWTPSSTADPLQITDQVSVEEEEEDGETTSGSGSRVPLEWQAMVALHARILHFALRCGGRIRSAVVRVESASVGMSAPTVLGASENKYVPSPFIRAFWTIVPWLVAGTALATTQVYVVTILTVYLEPRQLSLEWMWAALWAIAQGWLVEPVVILARNNLAFCAQRRSTKFYQVMEQIGCGACVRCFADLAT